MRAALIQVSAPGAYLQFSGLSFDGGTTNGYSNLGGSIPPLLIANNLVYQNGGRCIENLHVQHVCVVNNTCYMNGLDSRLGMVGELQNHDAGHNRWVGGRFSVGAYDS
jgi:hypothetical protein